jgi:hypothetical protein
MKGISQMNAATLRESNELTAVMTTMISGPKEKQDWKSGNLK